MLLNDLRRHMSEYNIKQISDKEYKDLHNLQRTNPQYFSLMQDHEVTQEESIDGTKALPPDTDINQKFYIGFYRDGNLEVIMDYIENYPQNRIVWIGLLMVDGIIKRKGLGKKVMESFLKAMTDNEFHAIQLGVIDMNNEGLSFWSSFDFYEIRRSKVFDEENVNLNIIVMEKVVEE